MKKYLTIAAGLIAGAASMMVASPAMAGHVDVGINIGVPGFFAPPIYVEPQPVYVQPQPVYVQSRPVYVERERGEWRARQWRERHEHREHHEHDNEYRGHDHGEHHGHDD